MGELCHICDLFRTALFGPTNAEEDHLDQGVDLPRPRADAPADAPATMRCVCLCVRACVCVSGFVAQYKGTQIEKLHKAGVLCHQ